MENHDNEEPSVTGGWTDGIRKAAKIVLVLMILGGVGVKMATRSMEPPMTREEFRKLNAVPPKHNPVFGQSQVSIGEDVEIAAHHAEVDDETITWHSTLLIRTDREDRSAGVDLARPLEPETTLVNSDPAGATFARNADKQIVAILPPPDLAKDVKRLTITTRHDAGAGGSVQPPLIGDHVSQRITVSGAYYESGEDTPLTHWGIFRKTEDVSYPQVKWIDEHVGEPPSHNGVSMYVRGHDNFFANGGLSGRFIPWFRLWATLGLVPLVAAMVLGLALVVRRKR